MAIKKRNTNALQFVGVKQSDAGNKISKCLVVQSSSGQITQDANYIHYNN